MIRVEKISPQAWKSIGAKAHQLAFGEGRPTGQERLDFALLVLEDDTILGYMTCRELDAVTLQWLYGGVIGKSHACLTWRGLRAAIHWCKAAGYEKLLSIVENTNRAMLKLELTLGFLIFGLRMHAGHVLVENFLSLEEVKP